MNSRVLMSESTQGSVLLRLITEISISNLSLPRGQLLAFIPLNRAGTILGVVVLMALTHLV